ncbi:DUF551 domain-containing protein [Raoultella ornithinolytica]|uniref:DUF551 domain-containing protein n=1 Tax=Raoultella ornithinolytica TaxID=54291 RepID=UPI001E63D07D|nr:DUF551 domain-containing protein [Raoultella ornithinolytica]
MTNNQLTDAQISNATLIRLIRWADEHNSHYVAAALRELQERRKAAMDSEPVFFIEVEGDDWINAGRIEGKNRQDLGLLPDGINYLYAAPQPAPVVPDGLLSMAASAIEDLLEHTDPNTSYYSGVWADVPGKLRAAILAAARQSPGSEPATVPGKWIAVSERMPDDDDFVYIWPRPDFGVELHVGQYCECSPKGDGWYAQVYEQNYGIEWYPITVTHWMPLPADPQEVKGE